LIYLIRVVMIIVFVDKFTNRIIINNKEYGTVWVNVQSQGNITITSYLYIVLLMYLFLSSLLLVSQFIIRVMNIYQLTEMV